MFLTRCLRSSGFAASLLIFFLLTACGNLQTKSDEAVLQKTGSASLPAKDDGSARDLPIVNEQITLTIAEKMMDKCKDIHSSRRSELEACKKAAQDLAEELDFSFIRRSDGNFAFIFLRNRLRNLLSDSNIREYFIALQGACLEAIYSNKKFNLWDFTVQQSQGRKDVALERIAVLFQDGSETAAQKKFLLVEQHPLAFTLGETLELLDLALAKQMLEAYPQPLKLTRTTYYHYYMPRFLAQRLRERGHSPHFAYLLPFVFNSVYELRKIQKSENPNIGSLHQPVTVASDASPSTQRLVGVWNRFDEIYSQLLEHMSAPLRPFKPKENDQNLEDLYLGYAGSVAGANNGLPATFEDFKLLFPRAPVTFFAK